METRVKRPLANDSINGRDHARFDTRFSENVMDHAGSAGFAVGACHADHAQLRAGNPWVAAANQAKALRGGSSSISR